MKKLYHIKKRFFNIPVRSDADKVRMIWRDIESDSLLRYSDVPVDSRNPDYIAFYDMSEVMGKNIEIEVDDEKNADQLFSAFNQNEQTSGLENLYKEKHRPQYHFSSRRGWLNDPNGLVYYKGIYHLFYQHNPFYVQWGNMHWGHAVSDDLVHWRESSVALHPDEMGAMFSGGAVVDWNNTSGLQKGNHPPMVLFYTATGGFCPDWKGNTQCVAYSIDGGKTFEKYGKNPVVGYTEKGARDPKVIWHEPSQQWIMTFYLGDQKGTFILLKSTNLLEWKKIQELAIPGGGECPEFFSLPVDGKADNMKWIFMEAAGKYLIGNFNGEKFETESGPHSSFGWFGEDCCYAGQTWSDVPDGRRIYIAWQRGDCWSEFFNGTMTVPVELLLKSFVDGIRLCAEPVRELEKIREKSWEFDNIQSRHGLPEDFSGLPKGNTWDIEIEMGDDCDWFLNICGKDIALDAISREIRMDAAKLPFAKETKNFSVRVLVDHASIELFSGDGRIWFAKRVLTIPRHPLQLCNGSGTIKKLKIHKMKSIWDKT